MFQAIWLMLDLDVLVLAAGGDGDEGALADEQPVLPAVRRALLLTLTALTLSALVP